MSQNPPRNSAFAAGVWLLVAAGIAFGIKSYLTGENPLAKLQGALPKTLTSKGQKPSAKPGDLVLNLDSFSGYSIFRTSSFKNKLKAQNISLFVQDDSADIAQRIEALDTNKAQFAVFTIDSFLSSSYARKSWPASIVMAIDESKGADAILVKNSGPKNLQEFDRGGGQFVLTPDSPSEFLARVVQTHLRLEKSQRRNFSGKDGSSEVLKAFEAASASSKDAYVMWEPDVSLAMQAGGRKLLDLSLIHI